MKHRDSVEGEPTKMKKTTIIAAKLIEDEQAYKNKTNEDVENEILDKIPPIPYVAEITKVTVLDYE